ncbi:MAG: CDP-alcohol phosphatidyltransferase family protein [Victivallaceae bacterium]|nr:CDP-alcohol phosphatidyltransferase family protein [Victivallaceae bacterium]
MKKKLSELSARYRWMKHIPNLLTLCNSLCGFAAILWTLEVFNFGGSAPLTVFAVSSFIILFAMIFDMADGFVARILDAASLTGIQMDSLSDMVTFGVAPATVVAIMTYCIRGELTAWQLLGIYLLCCVYIGGAALRLAKYNVHAMVEHKSSNKFAGLPSPGAAAAICCLVLFAWQYEWNLSQLAGVLPIFAALLGLLMVSDIPYLHIGKWLVRPGRRKYLLILVVIVALALFKTLAALLLIVAYILSGPLMIFSGRDDTDHEEKKA